MCGCDCPSPVLQTGDLSVYEARPFGNILFDSDFASLARAGIHPGDSVDVLFASGKVLEDLPFLSGCILPEGTICLNAHEGFDWLRIEKRFGNAWEHFQMRENETARILLRESGKYAFLYRVFNAEFSLERKDYPSDEYFSNYRELSGGRLKKKMFYRSASSFPLPDDAVSFRERQQCIDALIRRDGIRFVLNMACDGPVAEASFPCAVYAARFPVDFSSPAFRNCLASALRALFGRPGPYLFQCKAGLDRTGFFCGLLEALAGADAADVVADYMLSYACLCGLSRESDPEKYDTLQKYQADRILNILTQGRPGISLACAAEEYLRQCGMEPAEITQLKNLLTE